MSERTNEAWTKQASELASLREQLANVTEDRDNYEMELRQMSDSCKAMHADLAKVTAQLAGARKDRDNAVMDWQAQVERLSQQLATALRERDEARAAFLAAQVYCQKVVDRARMQGHGTSVELDAIIESTCAAPLLAELNELRKSQSRYREATQSHLLVITQQEAQDMKGQQ